MTSKWEIIPRMGGWSVRWYSKRRGWRDRFFTKRDDAVNFWASNDPRSIRRDSDRTGYLY